MRVKYVMIRESGICGGKLDSSINYIGHGSLRKILESMFLPPLIQISEKANEKKNTKRSREEYQYKLRRRKEL